MKVACVLLFVAIGVASAAFSGSLIQRTQPLLSQASLRANFAVSSVLRGDRDLGIGEIIQQIIANVIAQANIIIAQIQEHAGAISGQVLAQAQALLQQLQQAASLAHGQALAHIQALIANLQNLLSGGGNAAAARQLLAKLDIQALLQQAVQAILSQLPTSEQIQSLIDQITPFLNNFPGVGSIIDQLTQLLLGNSQTRFALSTRDQAFVTAIQNAIANVQAAIASAIAQAQASGSQFIQEAIAHAQQVAADVAQEMITFIQNNIHLVGEAAQDLIAQLQAFIASLNN